MRKKKFRQFGGFEFRPNSKLTWISVAVFGVAIILGSLGYIFYNSEIFRVKAENIKSNIILNRTLKEMIVDKPLFKVDIKAIFDYLSKEDPRYKEICILKKFPATLIIEVKKRLPFAQIKAGFFYPVDREGVVLSEGRTEPLTELIPIRMEMPRAGYFKKGKNIKNKELDCAFLLIEALEGQKFPVKSIDVANLQDICFFIDRGNFVRDLDNNTSAEDIKIVIGNNNFKGKIELLKDIINRELKDKMSSVKYIDLRYKKIYVGFLK